NATVLHSGVPGSSAAARSGPLMLIETPLLLLLMLVPFVALCVAIGMNWSLKARGVLGAIIPSVAIIGVLTLIAGLCGVPAAENIDFIGAIINAFSPATNLFMITNPWASVARFIDAPIAGRI